MGEGGFNVGTRLPLSILEVSLSCMPRTAAMFGTWNHDIGKSMEAPSVFLVVTTGPCYVSDVEPLCTTCKLRAQEGTGPSEVRCTYFEVMTASNI